VACFGVVNHSGIELLVERNDGMMVLRQFWGGIGLDTKQISSQTCLTSNTKFQQPFWIFFFNLQWVILLIVDWHKS